MNDLKFALRQLLKNPGFTAVAVLTLALGIGANTAIFSLIDHVMLRLLPVRNPQELVVLPGNFSYPRYARLRDLNTVFSETFGVHVLPNMEVSLAGQLPVRATGELVSGSYFNALGVDAVLGRTLLPEDDRAPESSPVAVISYGFWKRALGGATDVLGKTISVRSTPGYAGTGGLDIYDGADARSAEGAALTIVGVAPPEFFGETVGRSTDVWIPMMMEPAVLPGRPWLNKDNVSFVTIMGRRKPEVREDQASAAMSVLWRQIQTDEAGANLTEDRKRAIAKMSLKVESGGKGFSWLRGQYSQPLKILMTVVALVLLIACLNVANLLLARSTARQRELGVRLALGAGRARLIRQLLIESLLLGLLGGVAGLLVGFVGTKILVTLVSSGYQPIHLPLRPDLRALGFTMSISLITTLLFGLTPAILATRNRIAETLKDATRGTANRQRGRAGKLLVAIQVAVSVVLLVGAGLFLRTLFNLRTQDVGYDPDRLVMMWLDPVSAGYQGDDIGRVCKNILDRIAVLPGVRAATFSENGLFFGTESWTMLEVEGFTPGSEEDKRSHFDQVGPGYFSNVGIPLLLGRDITERDSAKAPRVAVINEALAKFYFPGSNPIGKHITTRIGNKPLQLEIVGVGRDAQDHDFWAKPVRRFYVSYFQPIDGITGANFAIRIVGNPAAFDSLLRREVQAVDRSFMVLGIREVKTLMNQSLVQERLIAQLSAFFGVLALLLAAIGLYGVLAYDVLQRTKEIGVRMALGAQKLNVLSLVIGQGMKLALAGLGAGVLVALALTRVIRSLLYGTTPTDPVTFIAVALTLASIAFLACYIPARRATKVNPMEALRYE